MEFEEHLSAFMDSALAPEEEAELLHILSVSPDKRALFHSYLSTHRAFVADMQATTVPARLDAAILGGMPTTTAPLATSGASVAVWWTGRRALSALVAGLLLFTGGFLSRSFWQPTSEVQPSISGVSMPGQPAGASPLEASTPTAPGHDATRPAVPKATGTRTVYVRTTDTVYLPGPALTSIEYRDRIAIDTMYVEREVPVSHAEPTLTNVFPAQAIALPSFWKRFEVALQREHVTTFPYIEYQRLGADRVQQQFTVAAAYNFDEHHAAGFMIGRKPFAQEFYSINRDSIYLIQQQPDLVYGAGFYRFSLPIGDVVAPQLALSVGGTDVGPLIGAQLSIAVEPFHPLKFYVGSNASFLVYKYKDKLFTSSTLGFLYGIQIGF
jgi:hypothetical protein